MLTLGVVTLISVYLSDRYKTRAIPAALISTIAVIGYAVYFCKSFPLTSSRPV
jgi:hypothetical protein